MKTTQTILQGRAKYAALMAACVLAGMSTMLTPAQAAKGASAGIRLRAILTGPAIGMVTPTGSAKFKTNTLGNRSELEVEAEHVNLPAGTSLDVLLGTTNIGKAKVNSLGEAELELDSSEGALVPAVKTGDTVSVSNAGTVILTGVF